MADLTEHSYVDRDRSTIVKQLLGVLFLLLLLVGAQGWQIVKGLSVKSQTWEYVIEGPPDEQLQSRLQTLGSAGWELVFARRATSDRDGKTAGIYEMILRRPADAGAGSFALPTPPPPQ